MGPVEQQILIDFMNSGKGVYLEGTNLGFDHQGTDFWEMFGAVYLSQGAEHGDVEEVTGYGDNFAVSMNFGYQSYSFADIFINRLSPGSGEGILHSEEMYTRTVAKSGAGYNAISSAVLFGAMSDGEGLSRKVDLMRLYLAYLYQEDDPSIWTSQSEIDFGYVLNGNSQERQLIIQNSGLNELNIESISLTNEHFTLESEPSYDLAFGQNVEISLNFSADETGIFASELEIISNDPDYPVLTIPITVNCFQPQVISVEPLEFDVSAGENEIVQEALTISNLGGGILDYQILVYAEGEESGFRESGGPDNFGHYWKDSFEESGPEFEWLDISQYGVNLGITNVNSHADIELPFPFYFYGNVYENIAVSSNGYLTFGNNADDSSNDQIPFVIDPDNFIAPLWDYLTPASGSVYSYFDESQSRFIIQYTNWSFYISGGQSIISFQVQLHPNGDIIFVYESLEGDLTSCTVGIENYNASDGLQIAYNEEYLQSNMAIEISFQPEWLQLSQYMGSILNNEPEELVITFNSSGLSPGVHNAEIQIHSNDTHNSQITIPVAFTVSGTELSEADIPFSDPQLSIYPNPFNPSTTISFSLTAEAVLNAGLGIYNLAGQKIKDLSSSHSPAGISQSQDNNKYSVIWNGTDDKNNSVASGIYFFRLSSGELKQTRKMLLLK
ncbi:MAG: hypothetical protein APR54_04880 [Candidatus Cloacimonas sp. SDB]|nr:MAG: hypothetical protein APR54_04880 [Candidatus Cloacimonas sp. SDB]